MIMNVYYVGVNKMVFLLVLVMTISPCKTWSVETYDNLKVREIEQSLREDQIHSQKLRSLFVQFQKQYLNFEFKKAQSSLKEIVKLQLLKDWNEEERKIFSTSYLRLAQMDELYRYKWIDRFLAFNDKLFIDKDIFPPSFIQWVEDRYKRYQRAAHLWYGQNLPESVKTVLINGEGFNRLGFSRRIDFNTKYRVTLMKSSYNQNENEQDHFISNEDPYFILILRGKDLINYPFDILNSKLRMEENLSNSLSQDIEPELIPTSTSEIVQEHTLSDKVLESDSFYQNKKLFESNLKFEDPIFASKENKSLYDLSSLNTAQKSTNSLMMEKENLKKQPSTNFFKKHKWFLIIFSGITVGLVISYGLKKASSQKQKRQNVTHREDIYY